MLYTGIVLLIMAGCFILRGLAERKLKLNESKKLEKVPVTLTKYHNTGISNSRLKDRPETAKLVATLAVGVVVVLYLMTLPFRGRRAMKLGFAFILGGGLANLLERHRYGYVTDYLKFRGPFKRIGRLIFNAADLFIFLGVLIAALGAIIEE